MKKYLIGSLIVFSFYAELFSEYRVLFRKRDDLQAQLLQMIQQEKKSIDIIMYSFFDKDVFAALEEAQKRGVQVSIALDPFSAKPSEEYPPLDWNFLRSLGANIYVYLPKNILKNPFRAILHSKVAIFGLNKIYNKPMVWTGSYNFTGRASWHNYENVFIAHSQYVVGEYKNFFAYISGTVCTKITDENIVKINDILSKLKN